MGMGMNLLLYAWLSDQSLELSGFENNEDDIWRLSGSQADYPLLVGAIVDWNLSNDLLLFIPFTTKAAKSSQPEMDNFS